MTISDSRARCAQLIAKMKDAFNEPSKKWMERVPEKGIDVLIGLGQYDVVRQVRERQQRREREPGED